MAQLGRPVQREDQLGVPGLLGPQRAVVVEYRDAVPLGDESGESGSVTAATNSTIDCLAVVWRQLGSSSALIGRLLRLMLTLALIG